MSFGTVAQCVRDQAFVDRVIACVAQEQIAKGENAQPSVIAGEMLWTVAGADDVEEAYAYALTSANPNPGGDETVITDAMILSHVQASWPAGRS